MGTISELYSELNKNDVFIVAGGPSIKTIDLSHIQNKKIIAVNNSYKLFPNATAIYWCDAPWADQHSRALDNHRCPLRFTSRLTSKLPKHKGPYNSTVLQKTGDFGFDPNMTCVRGNNSGTQALNLVVNMNPSRIFLLGYDMCLIDRNTHWHKDHILPVSPSIYSNEFIPSLVSMAEDLKNHSDVEIINCSMNSALECFKKDDIKNYI